GGAPHIPELTGISIARVLY
ncbi:unnamed protein product, partial [Adineta steineri]